MFIDESGPFDEGITRKAASLVGGVCGVLDDAAWEAAHRQQLDAFGRGSRIRFAYPDHYHCGKLLEGRLRVTGPVTRRDIESFTDDVFATACRSAAFVFASKNTGKRFESSPQATYVLNLVAATRKAVESLGTLCPDADSVEIVVAQRTISETVNSTYPDYMPRMLDYIKEQLLAGESPSVALARRLDAEGRLTLRWAVGDRNAGLIAADFVSCLLRGGKKPPDGMTVAWTHPDEVMFGDYRRYYDQEVLRLLKQKQYSTAADVLRRYFPTSNGHPDYAVLVHALRKEDDGDVLMRELTSLLVLARFLIDRRTQEPGNLGCAQELLTQLVRMAEASLTERSGIGVQRAWACLLVDALADLAACHNHLGAIGPQQDIQARLATLLTTHKDLLPGSHTARKERLLDIRNRNLNQLFNDYRFADVLSVFAGEVDRREAEVPRDEPDDLLGQMQGSMGQACAFLARTDTTWTDMAREYFEKSIMHFRPGTVFHSMSVNYLATLAWQVGDLPLACSEMGRHSGAPKIAGAADLAQRLPQILSSQGLSSFDAVNYLRIAASYCDQVRPMAADDLKSIQDVWIPRMTSDHPYEQVCKWLGYMLIQAGEYDAARQLLSKGVQISKSMSFTVQTIGLSLLGLIAVADKSAGNQKAHAEHVAECAAWATDLAAQSTPFASYLSAVGGLEGLNHALSGNDGSSSAATISRILPFSYA
jgi:hypothetical protein